MAARLTNWAARWQAYRLSAGFWRTCAETLTLAVLLSLLSILIYGERSKSLYSLALIGFINPLCALHYGLRLRLPSGDGLAQFRAEVLRLCGLVFIGGLLGIISLSQLTQHGLRAPDLASPLLLVTAMMIFPYLFFRAFVRFWLWWGRLRRRHLVWSLMHSHLMAVSLMLALIVLPVMLYLMSSTATPWMVDYLGGNFVGQFFYRLNVTLLVFGLAILASLGVLLLLAPTSALVSYFLARRIRQRLDVLIAATHAARDGAYHTRIPVSGVDEISQMQFDFNAMLTSLESAIHALEKEQDKVSRLLKLRQELFANVSHDLRTPLATLHAQLDALENAPSQHECEQPGITAGQLTGLQGEVTLLTRLVDDLFSLARADTDQLALRITPTDTAAIILNVVRTSAPLAWQSGRIEVIAQLPAALPYARADAMRLEQTLRNLIHNSRRYTLPGGVIAVSAQASGGQIHIQVRDTGSGIPPQDLPHIWDRYYRDPEGGGTGLGLTLAKAFVESMGGKISVESTLGQGTCFSLRLPAIADAQSHTALTE
jgi:signal transduction histidine kinase